MRRTSDLIDQVTYYDEIERELYLLFHQIHHCSSSSLFGNKFSPSLYIIGIFVFVFDICFWHFHQRIATKFCLSRSCPFSQVMEGCIKQNNAIEIYEVLSFFVILNIICEIYEVISLFVTTSYVILNIICEIYEVFCLFVTTSSM